MATEFRMMVKVIGVQDGCAIINSSGYRIDFVHLHPLPPSVTPEQQAVIEAAEKWRKKCPWTLGGFTPGEPPRDLAASVDAMHAAQRPPDPVKELQEAAKGIAGLSPQHARLRAAIAAHGRGAVRLGQENRDCATEDGSGAA